MRLFRLFVATLCLSALWLSAAPADAAGTLTFSPIMWKNRASGRLNNTLNRADCLADLEGTTSVSIRGIPSGNFEIWSGTGCDTYTNRSPTSPNRTCSLVFGPVSPIDRSVTIKFRDLIKAFGDNDPATGEVCDRTQTAGLISRTLFFTVSDTNNMSLLTTQQKWDFKFDVQAPPPPTGVTAASGDGTLVTTFAAPANETNLLRYHFYCSPKSAPPVTVPVDGTSGTNTGGTTGTDTGGTTGTDTGGTTGTDTGGTTGTDTGGTTGTDTGGTTGTDTGGTTGTDVGGTETGGTTGTETGGTDTTGTGGTAGTDAAGTSGTTGAATAGTAGTSGLAVNPNCASTLLVPGKPVPEGAIECGSIGAQGATGGETSPVLMNDEEYAIGVATEDASLNIGVISNLACGIPKDVTGFYEAYREAGGEAGGGYCTFAPAKHGLLGTIVAFGLGALAFLRRRK